MNYEERYALRQNNITHIKMIQVCLSTQIVEGTGGR